MVSTVRERDFSRNLGEEDGTKGGVSEEWGGLAGEG
jgi:hypothetical protein